MPGSVNWNFEEKKTIKQKLKWIKPRNGALIQFRKELVKNNCPRGEDNGIILPNFWQFFHCLLTRILPLIKVFLDFPDLWSLLAALQVHMPQSPCKGTRAVRVFTGSDLITGSDRIGPEIGYLAHF